VRGEPAVETPEDAIRCFLASNLDALYLGSRRLTKHSLDDRSSADLVPVLRALAEKVSSRLKRSGLAGRTIVLKLKTHDFKIRTRNRQLADPTQLADRIFQTGLQLLDKETDGTKYRLLGIGVSDLSGSDRADPPVVLGLMLLEIAAQVDQRLGQQLQHDRPDRDHAEVPGRGQQHHLLRHRRRVGQRRPGRSEQAGDRGNEEHRPGGAEVWRGSG